MEIDLGEVERQIVTIRSGDTERLNPMFDAIHQRLVEALNDGVPKTPEELKGTFEVNKDAARCWDILKLIIDLLREDDCRRSKECE